MSEIKVNSIKGVSASSAAISINNTDGTCTANITNNLSNRNKIINGSMVISQRTSSQQIGGTEFKYAGLDRYKIRNSSDGVITVSQDSSEYPPGFRRSLKVACTTADTSITGAQTVYIAQFVEAQNLQDLAYGTSSAKSITISFYVRSNKTGTYAMRVQQADSGFKQAGFNYTINTQNTWERKTFTLAGDTAGAINDDNGTGLEFYWLLAAGPTYQGGSANATYQGYSNADFGAGQTVNILDNTSNTFFITGIQVEVGSVATDFEHRSFGQELALCQRYFELVKWKYYFVTGYYQGNGNPVVPLSWNVEKRATPTVTLPTVGTGSGQIQVTNSGGSWDTSSTNIAANHISTLFTRIEGSGYGGSASTVCSLYINGTDGSVQINAEL